MAHYAKLDSDYKVLQVIVVDNNDITDSNKNESEQIGIDYLTELTGYSNWRQSSYNNTFRVKHAAPGDVYNNILDCFHEIEAPFPSWVFSDENRKWEAPVSYPEDGKDYGWVELTKQWVEIPLHG